MIDLATITAGFARDRVAEQFAGSAATTVPATVRRTRSTRSRPVVA